MWPDWVSNPEPLTNESGALQTALSGPAGGGGGGEISEFFTKIPKYKKIKFIFFFFFFFFFVLFRRMGAGVIIFWTNWQIIPKFW